MSTPFRLPKLVGRKHVVASAVQEIPQFECNKLHVEKHIGRGSFGEVFLTEFRNTDKEPAEKVVVKRMLELGRGTKDGGHAENVLVVSLQFRSPSGG